MSIINISVDLGAAGMRGMERNILQEFAMHMNNAITNSISTIVVQTERSVVNALRASPTWVALDNGGELQRLFRLQLPSATLFQIERNIISSMRFDRVPINIGGQFVTGGFRVGLLDDSYADALSASGIVYSTINGIQITWLEWLM